MKTATAVAPPRLTCRPPVDDGATTPYYANEVAFHCFFREFSPPTTGQIVAIGQFFSQRFGYGIHALAFIARKPQGELTTLPELADWVQAVWPTASETYLSNVIQRLARSRLLRSHRGAAGGYSLGRAASKITIRDVVEVLEGIDTGRCLLSLENECPVLGQCAISRKMEALETTFLDALAGVTIEDLSQELVDPRIAKPVCVEKIASPKPKPKRARA